MQYFILVRVFLTYNDGNLLLLPRTVKKYHNVTKHKTTIPYYGKRFSETQ